MSKSKAKTKRNPNSKPKNQTHFLTTPPYEQRKRKERREDIFYSLAMVLFFCVFVGLPVTLLGATLSENNNSADKPAVSSTPNVNLTTGVDGHLSDGNIDPKDVEESDYDKYLKEQQQEQQQEQTANPSEATPTENAE